MLMTFDSFVILFNSTIIFRFVLFFLQSSIRDKYGNTPLHLACVAGDLDCVRALTQRITATEAESAVSCSGVLLTKSAAEKSADTKSSISSRMHLVQYADVELRNYDGEFLFLSRLEL